MSTKTTFAIQMIFCTGRSVKEIKVIGFCLKIQLGNKCLFPCSFSFNRIDKFNKSCFVCLYLLFSKCHSHFYYLTFIFSLLYYTTFLGVCQELFLGIYFDMLSICSARVTSVLFSAFIILINLS